MECIICQDSGSESLQMNTSCNCKYNCHNSCWIDYVHSKTILKCPICRKELSVKSIPKKTTVAPPRQETPQPSESSQESWQQITYQEFIDTIAQSNSYQQTVVITQPTPKPVSNIEKLLKIILLLCILAMILVLIWV